VIGCFAAGTLMLFAILARYVHSRLTLASWNVGYGQATSGPGNTYGSTGAARTAGTPRPPKRKNIYDKWLVLRFSVAFCGLRYVHPLPPPFKPPLSKP
jgi:hypothetical protein